MLVCELIFVALWNSLASILLDATLQNSLKTLPGAVLISGSSQSIGEIKRKGGAQR